jgi:serine/threonine-protein kinase
MDESPASFEAPLVPTASAVTDTEEGRAFFQRRLALFGLTLFALAGGSWAVLALVSVLSRLGGRSVAYNPLREGGPFHLGIGLISGALWLIARKGRRSGPVLHGLDIVVTIVILTGLTLGAASTADPVAGGYMALLCFYTVMLARAIVVPSTARRTLLLGIVSGISVVAIVVVHGAMRSEGAVSAAASAICWTASAIALATVASLTIFRLRREAQQARVLGQYTLEAKIGEGGMGEVWQASHVLLKRPTAVKLLPPSRTGEAAIRRFEREVKLTARLRHPSTVAIYDYGRTRDGVFYYAMELLEGVDLELLVTQHGPQPPGRVVHVLSQVCGALAEAHGLGLVHRDIKPANVLLLPKHGEPELAKVVDFGLVKDLQDPRGAQAGLTAANTITGTPLYMAPEAIQKPDSIDAASDLYALGAVGWFLLVGRPVFEGVNIIEVCSKHLHEPPARPSEALRSPIATDLEDAILSCLEKKQTRRPRDARELRRRLQACSVAGEWTEEQAAQWWQDHERLSAPTGTAMGSRTIALDIAGRAVKPLKAAGWSQ